MVSQESPQLPADCTTAPFQRSDSMSAQDFIASQLSLEADAREALPYQFDTCTKDLGPLRQSIYACLTCAPPPASKYQQFTPAGVCYSCSISCHGEHNLVELFTKRDFVCDCGTMRLSNSGTSCSLRFNPAAGRKGGVAGEEARQGNKYNQNFEGKFCGCGDEYDPEKEKGTMFQCLGLGTVEDGGCGEDWWHPECLMGLPRTKDEPKPTSETNGSLNTVKEEAENVTEQPATDDASGEVPRDWDEAPLPEGFPQEDDFDHFICYKCVDAFPWIKKYAGTAGFLPALPATPAKSSAEAVSNGETGTVPSLTPAELPQSKKRKAEDDSEDSQDSKKPKGDDETSTPAAAVDVTSDAALAAPETLIQPAPKHNSLATPPVGSISIFVREDFREHLCRCSGCFSRLAEHPQLLEEEEPYEPPVSESDAVQHENGSVTGRSVNSGSLLERGEAALSSMDRVRAIEGVMAYNHVRDKVKAFLQPFAESGQPVGAEDIKTYFTKLRGDEQAMREAAVGAANGESANHRSEQGGY